MNDQMRPFLVGLFRRQRHGLMVTSQLLYLRLAEQAEERHLRASLP